MTLNEDGASSDTTKTTVTDQNNASTQPQNNEAPKNGSDSSQVSTSTDANKPQNSSTVDGKDAKQTLLDVAKDAVKRTAQQDGKSSDPGQKRDQSKVNPDPNAPKDGEQKGKENTIDDTRFDQHPRFQHLLNKNKTYEEALKKIGINKPEELANLATINTDAGHYREVLSFMGESNLVQQEVQEGFVIMAAMKNDPIKALELLAPYYQKLQQLAGDILPDDLQQKVDEGLLDRETAKEVARQRTNSLLVQKKEERITQQNDFAAQQRQLAQTRSMVATVMNEWEVDIQQRDPDYAKKVDLVLAQVKSLMAEAGGLPPTKEDARAVIDLAYQKVNRSLGGFVPRRAETLPNPSSVNSSTTTSASTAPKSYLEAAMQGLKK